MTGSAHTWAFRGGWGRSTVASRSRALAEIDSRCTTPVALRGKPKGRAPVFLDA
ncbi:MAG: hypothetical protein ABSA65_18330 [Acidimicrobiales bacterium]|jgi:hypothetical protein